ncbi:hypothetical protein BGZ97_010849 [Linnemannia gamsii]|uniref:Velvet domain-containing protein n=1 Tax=Linnemannia gamsii TaxID=64522 RepID=A0A9P6R4Z3_9FUNG|nr:hypothetical protein BGZ97_010849 [Linnemannia gamsii]
MMAHERNNRTYELQMAQNPVRARMCGFGEKDRRPMDPPPILKLIVRNEDGTLADVSQMDVNFYMVIADIYSADRTTPCTLVANPAMAPQTTSLIPSAVEPAMSVMSLASSNLMASRNLTGSTVASGNLLFNLENEPGVYFVFQDISVRSEGIFTLKFSFTLPPTPDGPPSSVMATVFSDQFTIFSAKRFPGMTESTPLSKCFAKQGIKIPIRKEPRISRAKRMAGGMAPDEQERRGNSAGGEGGSAGISSSNQDRDMASESDDDDDGQG